MADTDDAMEEFRLLEEKRNSLPLSEPEQHRWYALAQYLGIPTEAPQGFYGQDGQWYPSPPYYPQPAYGYPYYPQPYYPPAPSNPPYSPYAPMAPGGPAPPYAPYGMDAYGQPLTPYASPQPPAFQLPVEQAFEPDLQAPAAEDVWDIPALNEATPPLAPSPTTPPAEKPDPLPSVVVDPILLAPSPLAESDVIDLFPIEESPVESSGQPLGSEPAPETEVMQASPSVEEIELSAEDEFFHSNTTASAPSHVVQGEHRVVIHTLDGQVRRGLVRDLDVADDVVPLDPQTGAPVEALSTQALKAIFFMLPTGTPPLQAQGDKVRVTFNDGRQMAGYSTDYQSAHSGFFLVPADNRTNTARLYIYKSGILSVTPH